MLTTRSSAILVVNRTATRFDPKTILRTPVRCRSYQKVVLVAKIVSVEKSKNNNSDSSVYEHSRFAEVLLTNRQIYNLFVFAGTPEVV